MKYSIFSTNGEVTGEFSEIIPAVPGDGLKWDISRINEGIIAIVESDQINDIYDTNDNSVNLYPTVVRNSCFVNTNSSEKLKIDIFTISGVKLKSIETQIHESVKEIDMQDFQKGIYFIRIIKGNKTVLYQIIKE